MQIDALAVRLRPRTSMEAADLGVRLCQSAARSVYPLYLRVAIPIVILAVASFEIADWLPMLAIWWLKPWLDRTILFALSRPVFNQKTTWRDLWAARRQVWFGQILLALTLQRVSFWRALTQPVYQLEGGGFWGARRRARQLRRGAAGAAFLTTQVFSLCEMAIASASLSLMFWFAPAGRTPDISQFFDNEGNATLAIATALAYGAAVLFLEPFYVATGFAQYLNRRAALEAWDIEQEFRRAFTR
jgi:hypothetical protein